MRVLFWVPPWATHGDPLFYLNCVKKHLIIQANTLSDAGLVVDFVLPEIMSVERGRLSKSINVIDFSFSNQLEAFGSHTDLSIDFYKKNNLVDCNFSGSVRDKFAKNYDVIMLWETPVPFLEAEFPDALIVHQMPGIFSRPPYPHTVTFDPVGLYKRSSLFSFSDSIKGGNSLGNNLDIASIFSEKVRESVNAIQPFNRSYLSENKYKKLRLLPLQVSAHYAFLADTGYKSQADFLVDVMSSTPEDVGVVVTQYVTPNVSDTLLNSEVLNSLRRKWSNLIFKEEFNRISSISQYLLPLVDEVVTCSSSIGMQAMAWSRDFLVMKETALKPYERNEKNVDCTSVDFYNNTLNFILNKNQPLANSVVHDPKFLVGLLEEMSARKRSGKNGVDLCPDFSDIDPEYNEKLLNSFVVDRAARSLGTSQNLWASKQVDLGKFRRAVSDVNVKAISFDLFDTLIKRPTEVPADVYKFLETKAIELTNGAAEDYARVRLAAEVETRGESSKGEITLKEIYYKIKAHYSFEDDIVDALIKLEENFELEIITKRVFGENLWKIAVDTKKPIYVISDMYLDASVIRRLLEKNGFREYKELFLSSEYGVRKKEGGLFDVFLDKTKLEPDSIIHVGDNKEADVERAKDRGMRTFRIFRAIDRMRSNEYYKNIYSPRIGAGERARSIVAGLTAHSLFDSVVDDTEKTSLFHGDAANLGYAALGPMLTGFALWLGAQAKRDGVSILYFLSREGWIIKQVYDELHKKIPGSVPSCYLYASRRATRVASLTNKSDVLALASQPFQAGVTVGDLLNTRFGLELGSLDENVLEQSAYSDFTDVLGSDSESRVQFSEFCAFIHERILLSAAVEREGYVSYLKNVGVFNESNPAIVDIGWRANMQGALGALLGRGITGYYYATLQGAEVWLNKSHKIWAFAGDFVSADHPSAAVRNRHLLEYLTCHVDASLMRIDLMSDGKLIPIFRAEENSGNRRIFIEKVHGGIIRFAKDISSAFPSCGSEIKIDPFFGERVFHSFCTRPSAIDASLLLGHHFEDAVGGVKIKYIVSPKASDINSSVWKAGAEAILKSKPSMSKLKNAVSTEKPTKIIKIAESSDNGASAGDVFFNDAGEISSMYSGLNVSEKLVPNFSRKFEEKFIKLMSSSKKIAKYERDRDSFFSDSKNILVRKWYEWSEVK